MGAHELLYEAEQSAETTLGQALKLVEELARYDDRFTVPVEELRRGQGDRGGSERDRAGLRGERAGGAGAACGY